MTTGKGHGGLLHLFLLALAHEELLGFDGGVAHAALHAHVGAGRKKQAAETGWPYAGLAFIGLFGQAAFIVHLENLDAGDLDIVAHVQGFRPGGGHSRTQGTRKDKRGRKTTKGSLRGHDRIYPFPAEWRVYYESVAVALSKHGLWAEI